MSLKITIPVAATLTLQVTKSAGLSFISESPALVEPQTRGVAVLTVAMYSWTSSDPVPPHQHEIDDVTDLQDALDTLSAALDGYLQTFAVASDTWIVNHNLGREPNVQVLSTGGLEIEALTQHVSSNQAVVYFSSPQTGRVRCF